MAMKGKGKGVKKHAPRHVTLLVSVERKPLFIFFKIKDDMGCKSGGKFAPDALALGNRR